MRVSLRHPSSLVLLPLLSLATGCGFPTSGPVPPPPPPAEQARATEKWPDATPEMVATGRGLFVAKCNACHGYPDVKSIAEERWPEVMERMAHQAKLDAGQKQAVLRFVQVSRQAP